MTVQSLTITDIKQDIYQALEQFTSERLADLSLFLEQLLKIINAHRVNDSEFTQPNQLPQTEHPSLKFAGVFKDDPNWDEFQAAIAEYRREVDAEFTQPNQLQQTEQPWLKYTARLKDSPNWDEFLETIAEARREEDEKT